MQCKYYISMEKYIYPLIDLMNEMTPYLLLGFLIAGILHEFVPRRIYADKFSGNNFRSVLWAALLGIPLPLCSCGVIPTAASIRREGASKGATVSFLISTPQTGVDSIFATASLLGIPFAIIRPLAALVTALAGGCAVNRWCKEENGENNIAIKEEKIRKSFWKRCVGTLHYGFIEMLQDIGKWIVTGLVIAAAITILVPDNFFAQFNDYPILNMLIILALSIPMYLCATGSIPIAAALMLKGLSPGAALVLLMAGPATNMAAILVINKIMGRRTLAVYLLTIILGAMGFGLLIDCFLPAEWFVSGISCNGACTHAHGAPWWQTASSIIFVTLLATAFIMRLTGHGHKCSCDGHCDCKTEQKFLIKGMMCNHCKANVEKSLKELEGVTEVRVELSEGAAYIKGEIDPMKVKETINSLGYESVE